MEQQERRLKKWQLLEPIAKNGDHFMAEQIVAAFRNNVQIQISRMSWNEFLNLLDDIHEIQTQSGRGQSQ